MVKRKTKRFKKIKKNKKTKRLKGNEKKRRRKKKKFTGGGGWGENILGFFNGNKPQNVLENNKEPEKNENNENNENNTKCPKPKGVMEQINNFSKEQSETLVNTLNEVNVNIKKTAKNQVERTFNNLMGAMVSKSEKENVCPCCKRPYTDKEKVPVPKAGDEKAGDRKAGDEKAGDEKAGDRKAGDEKAGDEKAGDRKAGDEKAGMMNPDIIKELMKKPSAMSLREESKDL